MTTTADDSTPRILPEDELVCLGHGEDLAAQGGSMSPPIVQTSLFAQPSFDALKGALSAEYTSQVYSRGCNPTVRSVEEKIASLERGADCRAFASGMAAISGVLLGLLRQGDHVLFVNQTYGPTLQLAQRLERLGITHDHILEGSPDALRAALRKNTRVVWLESPGTMLFGELDLDAVAAVVQQHGALSVIDNSWATPLFQKPLTHGVDLVVHSATKYLGGHSDLVAGVAVGSEDLMERIFYGSYLLDGGILSPSVAWLLQRGLRTLPVRMRQHHSGGLAVGRHLASHPRVRRVFHPGLQATPPHRDQLTGYSGLLSFELDGSGFDDVRRFIDGLERFHIGVSWGGVESIVLSPARNDGSPPSHGMPATLVRLSVGLEPADILCEDLSRALEL